VKRQQLLDTVANLPACVIGMEACGSAQHWGRAFEQLGYTVVLQLLEICKNIFFWTRKAVNNKRIKNLEGPLWDDKD
jgi:transposase